jgi:hypothetical protein
MNFVFGFRRACAAWSHAYLSEETRVGDIAAPDGSCTSIMSLPWVLQGDVVGTSEVYVLWRGAKSRSELPSSVIICRSYE